MGESPGHQAEVYSATFLGQDMNFQYHVATACNDHRVRIFDMRSKKIVNSWKDHSKGDLIGIDFAPQTYQLATGGDDGVIYVYDLRKLDAEKKLHRFEIG